MVRAHPASNLLAWKISRHITARSAVNSEVNFHNFAAVSRAPLQRPDPDGAPIHHLSPDVAVAKLVERRASDPKRLWLLFPTFHRFIRENPMK